MTNKKWSRDEVLAEARRRTAAMVVQTPMGIQKMLESCAELPFEDIIGHVRQELGEYDREDDYTLIVLEVE